MHDYYEILQVHPKADQEAITAAYERLRERYDPERLNGAAEELVELARNRRTDLDRAYAVLKDAKRRATYDTELHAAQAASAQASAAEGDDSQDEELIDYRPLPAAGRHERPSDFNPHPYLTRQQAAKQRGRQTVASTNQRAPFFGLPAAVAAALTLIVGLVSLVVTDFGGPGTPVGGAAQNPQAQSTPSADQLTSQYEGQVTAAQQVVAQVPDNPNAWINLGNALYDSVEIIHEHMPDSEAYRKLLPRWLEAAEAYEKALKLDPDNANHASVQSDLGVCMCNYGVGMGDQSYVERGLQETEAALTLNAEDPRALLNRGICLVSADPPQVEDAMKNWRKILVQTEAPDGVLTQVQRLLEKYGKQEGT